MKIKLFVILLVGILFSCSSDFEEPAQNQSPSDAPQSEYAVPVEEALARLELALQSIAGDGDETRAVPAVRRAAGVRTVKFGDLFPGTRAEAVPGLEDLLYIVEFENGEGSAVLGADTRAEAIYAILDETVLTPEDFLSEPTRADTDEIPTDIKEYLLDLIKVTAYTDVLAAEAEAESETEPAAAPSPKMGPGGGIGGGGGGIGGGIGGGGIGGGGIGGGPVVITPAPKTEVSYSTICKQPPMTVTKWGQDSPYNKYCFDRYGNICPAGCVAIACGQVFAYNQVGTTVTIAGTSYKWDLINECNYGSYPSYEARIEIAKFIHAIGDYIGMNYTVNGSGATGNDALKIFRHLGYNASLCQYNTDVIYKARNMIQNRKPFLLGGITKLREGHAWVIDGWDEYNIITTKTTYRNIGAPIITTTVDNFCSVHCNFGWAGECDGYYSPTVFDTTKKRTSYQIDSSVGDIIDTKPWCFDTNLLMIVY